ncbi:hypothetical protein AB0M50_41225 [Nonomuraea fuscirosea]|jgi:hypothetical protein|uniref:hypothetical protein n=1 Tax=Nonomuraea fuscirosea TaxID=1291556 RepID=UPI002DDAA040|nr:hypothetical protein [Nonomuraea fuscirosea]WSA52584.1 hypothetical protein OIE67_52695 [Nonomuraea fuscirosea]
MESHDGLSAIAEVRAALADRLTPPWWYHPSFGLLLAGCVLAVGLGGTPVRIGGVVLLLAGCAAIAAAYRRLTGFWVSGFHAGPAGRWIGATGLLTILSNVAAFGVGSFTDLRWPVWCLAVVAFAAVISLGRRFDVALRAQLRAGA